jgi:dipeptidase E
MVSSSTLAAKPKKGKMKFLLTSSGISNASIKNTLVDLLGKPIAECTALIIPTSAYYFLPGGADIAYRLISGTAKSPLAELGWKSLGVLELTALPSVQADQWVPRVRATDALLVGGGDPQYLCHWMRESGFADLLDTLSDEAVYVGVSGGSMAVTSSFGENYNDRVVASTGSETPLGLIGIAMGVHMDHADMPDNSRDEVARWAAGIPVPTYGIDDQTAIKVVDGTIEIISEGHWELFPPHRGSN